MKVEFKEIEQIIKDCNIKLSTKDYCGERENLQDYWNEKDKTIEDILDDFCWGYYVNPAYNKNKPSLDELTLWMESGCKESGSEDYFVCVVKKGDDIVCAYYTVD